MFEPTFLTWVLIVFGIITIFPLLYAQCVILCKPQSKEAKDILIGEGEEWRDDSHFKCAYGLAITDWLVFTPIFICGIAGIIFSQPWGYLLFGIAGAIQLYINVFLRVFEYEYVYPSTGPLIYYTLVWGNFIYFGLASVIYTFLRFNGIIF